MNTALATLVYNACRTQALVHIEDYKVILGEFLEERRALLYKLYPGKPIEQLRDHHPYPWHEFNEDTLRIRIDWFTTVSSYHTKEDIKRIREEGLDAKALSKSRKFKRIKSSAVRSNNRKTGVRNLAKSQWKKYALPEEEMDLIEKTNERLNEVRRAAEYTCRLRHIVSRCRSIPESRYESGIDALDESTKKVLHSVLSRSLDEAFLETE